MALDFNKIMNIAKVGNTIASFIPGAQPFTAGIGMGLNLLDNIDGNDKKTSSGNNITPVQRAIENKNADIFNYTGTNKTDVLAPDLVLADEYNKTAKDANTMNYIGSGIAGAGAIGSLINEANAQPSEDLKAPVLNSVNLDSNQSGFVNAMNEGIDKGRATQTRFLQDMGMNPMLAGTMLESATNASKLKVFATAEQNRQSLEAKEAGMNANIASTAAQLKQRTDEINLQKQIQANAASSANISNSIMSLANTVTGLGGGVLNNKIWADTMINKI